MTDDHDDDLDFGLDDVDEQGMDLGLPNPPDSDDDSDPDGDSAAHEAGEDIAPDTEPSHDTADIDWEAWGERAATAADTVVAAGTRALDAIHDATADIDPTRARIAGAITAVAAVFVAMAVVAWLGWGSLAAILFVGGVAVGATGPPIAILLLRDGIPLGGLIGTGLAIAAMVGFQRAALVRREDGQFEWTALRGESGQYHARLSSGREVPIDAERGELFAFGLGELAVVEERGRNLDEFTVVDTPGDSDQPVDSRAGIPIRPPRREDGGLLVSLATIQRRVRGSASSTLVRRGRDKALDKTGGTGQLSELWTVAFATVLLIVGFGMTAAVMML